MKEDWIILNSMPISTIFSFLIQQLKQLCHFSQHSIYYFKKHVVATVAFSFLLHVLVQLPSVLN
jgi:hypothetical protein